MLNLPAEAVLVLLAALIVVAAIGVAWALRGRSQPEWDDRIDDLRKTTPKSNPAQPEDDA